MSARARLPAAIAAWITVAAAATANTTEAEIADRRLTVPIPPRMCELQPGLASDRPAFEALAKAQEPRNTLLAVFVACDRLGVMRQRGSDPGAAYALVLVARERGSVRPMAGVTRPEFAARMAGEIPRVDAAEIAAEVARHARAAGVFTPVTIEKVGLVGQDELAAYVSFIVSVKGGPATAGGSAITLVRDLPISFNHYDRFVDEGTLRRLVRDARSSVEALIELNPQLTAAPPRWYEGVEWERVGVAGMVGAFAVGAIALAGIVVSRRRRW